MPPAATSTSPKAPRVALYCRVGLYSTTTDILTPIATCVVGTLGSDWSMGGSQIMLDELRVADARDNAHWGNELSPKELLTMATVNGAAALSLADRLGECKPPTWPTCSSSRMMRLGRRMRSWPRRRAKCNR